MKKIFSHISKSTILAIAFFCVMTLVSLSTTHAQNDTVNPLISTTGPNVLPSGNIQWKNQFGFSNISYLGSSFKSREFTFDSRVRFGIGHRTELSLSLNTAKGSTTSLHDDNEPEPYGTLLPSIGAKLLIFEGEGWKPMIAFNTSLGFPVLNNRLIEDGLIEREFIVRPTIGLQFRNRLGSRWMLDYSLDLSWVYAGLPLVIPTIQARWLATDRLMLGGGIDEDGWNLSCLYQVSPDLQLSFKGRYSLISNVTRGVSDAHAFVGVNWMIRNPHK